MKKKHIIILVVMMICLLALAGSGVFVVSVLNSEREKSKGQNYETFAAWTDIEEFQTLPSLTGKQIKIGDVLDYGGNHYLLDVNGTTVEEYKGYLDTLIDAGFKKHSDNGEDAMEGYAYTAAFTKDDLTVVVSQVIQDNKTYISASYNQALSDHMIYQEDYVKDIPKDAKTKIHMLELNNFGTCLIIQLKNGHFVIHDGGQTVDTPYFLDYMESLTPGDEVPVVEGWFISHPHSDHYGVLYEIAGKEEYMKRIHVNGLYFHEPPTDLMNPNEMGQLLTTNMLSSMVVTGEGKRAPTYRPQYGQRYYFCDVVIDISMTTEQMRPESYYSANTNDTSTWFMHYIDGQKFFYGGDAFHGSIRNIMNMFENDYFNVDIFMVLHHGTNVYDYFVNAVDAKTILYPGWNLGSLTATSRLTQAEKEAQKIMQEKAEEAYSFQYGTVVLSFPYKVGTAEIKEPCDWRYNANKLPTRVGGWYWQWDGQRHYE